MNKINDKFAKPIKAFTVIELLIVMILSSVVVGLTYLYFSQFNNYLRSSSEMQDISLEYSRLRQVLTHDMDNAETILFKSSGLIALRINDTEIDYWIDNDQIIREVEQASDTFYFKTENLKILELKNYNNLVSQVEFDVSIKKDADIKFSFLKEYPAKTLFITLKKNKTW